MAEPSQADLLLLRAHQDERAFEILAAHPDSPSEVLGFHARQAAEKTLKAALSGLGVEYPYTHNLGFLLGLLRRHGVEVPEPLSELRRLTPFAVQLRYEVAPTGQGSLLDPAATRQLLRDLRAWVEALLEADSPEP